MARQKNKIDRLIFQGFLVNGFGTHVELIVPGKYELPQSSDDWPYALCAGSLNFKIGFDGYPDDYKSRFGENSVKMLDTEMFLPAFEIEQKRFGNNKIEPTEELPKCGSAQVWRASLNVNNYIITCWVLRRFGSNVVGQLEIVSNNHIRSHYMLDKNTQWAATLQLFGEWKNI